MSTQSAVDDDLFRKVALVVGFLAIAGSALAARANPATGYELSLYTMTSPFVWAGLVVALAVALAVAFVPSSGTSHTRGTQALALVLGGVVMVVFAGLPIIRGYRFYGHHDALTHLGWARAISEGTIVPFDLFYPGIHTVTVLINSALGIPLSRSLLFVVLISVLVFCVFVPLCVGTITQSQQAAAIAAFSAFLLLPITTISMYLQAHAMSQAVLFSALLFYLFVKYLRVDRTSASVSAIGVLFALTATATVVYHPQLVAHLIAVFIGISVVQYVARRFWSRGRIAGQTPMYSVTLFFIALFLVWTANHGFFSGMLEYFFESVIEYFFERGSGGEETIATQGTSLASLGGGLLEIFLKLFFPQLMFSLLAGGLALAAVVFRRSPYVSSIRAETTYFVTALVALVPLFLIYFAASGATMYFRVMGLMMVFVTILGSLVIYGLSTRYANRRQQSPSTSRPLLAAGFAVLLTLSLVAIFPSPYIYNASPHVSDAQMDGYGTAFETQADDVGFIGLRDGPNRFDDAINGNAERMHLHEGPPEEGLNSRLAEQYDGDRYLVLTQADRERETIAYGELRYSEAEFDSIATQPRVDRVQSNGEFELYWIRGNDNRN
ncbi:MFS transporter [Natronorubrum aibiense]|uniref:MFS transporter n=1 Tax=Natronorubrum aibiense TaxID=348826 RepID=A0A5P9PA77_9EURY|nr:MFS transporter [Natronorubrum aibiense]QFU85012.1 MFS transporter [Natronorubrum aibiense]